MEEEESSGNDSLSLSQGFLRFLGFFLLLLQVEGNFLCEGKKKQYNSKRLNLFFPLSSREIHVTIETIHVASFGTTLFSIYYPLRTCVEQLVCIPRFE